MIRIASSLTNRIFIASTLLAIVSLGLAFYFVNARVSSEAESDLRRSLTEAATLVDLRRENLTDTFRTMARLVADIPKLRAAMAEADAATAQPVADEYRQLISADLLVLADPRGGVLAVSGGDTEPLLRLGDPTKPLEEISTFLPRARGLLEAISVPVVTLDGDPPLIFGRLTVGFFMDDRLAARFKELTGTEVAFASQGKILASSLPREARDTLSSVLDSPGITSLTLGDQEYLCLARPMPHDGQGRQRDTDLRAKASASAAVPVMLVMQSRTERLSVLNSLRLGLAGALIITILLATLLSYFVARTITRPLAAVTGAMGDVAATGDLTRKVPVRSRAWDDEDARLLASAFNTLTESIGRFQKEAAQKERLSSLGRLSTVIAHEIRNPLMIIRATLTSLRRDQVSSADRLEAAADIDEETTRLNNLVSDVLDFAKPIRFELAPANLNDVCRASAAAAWAGHDNSEVQLELDPEMPVAVTDAERLRTALINILTNARHAVHAAAGTRTGGPQHPRRGGPLDAPGNLAVASQPGVIVKTRYAAGRVAITVQDFGTGISADDMGHIFDPYFTTRRKGTGLGLPIAKNIIEGLGGTITIASTLGEGTTIRLDLPLTAEGVA